LSPKNGPLGQHSGPGKDGQNNIKTPLLVMIPQKTQTQNEKRFFFRRQLEDLLDPSRIWTAL